jgi:hypothetical protein
MRDLFRSKHKVTQKFGLNPEYYKQFGLSGHEGLDVIPTGTVWDVKCLEDGVVVRDEDNARSGAYGVYATIWHPSIRKATQYCHMASNSVKNGEILKKGDVIGKMGSTGNSTGAHVHLNLFDVDESGVRLNRDNGYLGGTDPLPFLEEETSESSDLQEELNKVREERDRNWTWFVGLCEIMGESANFDTASVALEGFVKNKDQVIERDKQITNLNKEIEQVREEVRVMKEANTVMINENKKLEKEVQESRTDAEIQKGKLADTTEKLEQLSKQCNQAPLRGIKLWIYNIFIRG